MLAAGHVRPGRGGRRRRGRPARSSSRWTARRDRARSASGRRRPATSTSPRRTFLLSIGRGVEDQDDIPRFEELAERLGATLSVSRPLVDAGWMPSARQVGQSGKTVKPRVYLALGISGAVQHLAGMRTAETIIAVNTDPEAPIFGVAHYGAVADMFELADELEAGSRIVRRWLPLLGAASETRPVFWDFVTWLKVALVRARGRVGVRVRRTASRGRSRSTAAGRRAVAAGPVARAARARLAAGAARCCSRIARSPGATARPGWAHGAIFYGFIMLFAGTVILGFDTDFTDPVFGWNYFHGNFYLVYKEVLNVLRDRADRRPARDDGPARDRAPGQARLRAPGPRPGRAAVRPARVPVGDWAFVGILLVIALTGFLLEGVRIAMAHPGYGGTQFGGWVVAQPLTGVGDSPLAAAAPRAVVVPRPARDRVRRQHPVHEGGAHALELRQPGAARPARRQAAAPDRARARRRAGRLRRARRLQPAAPAPARRLHEVRALPRGVPGQRDRAARCRRAM